MCKKIRDFLAWPRGFAAEIAAATRNRGTSRVTDELRAAACLLPPVRRGSALPPVCCRLSAVAPPPPVCCRLSAVAPEAIQPRKAAGGREAAVFPSVKRAALPWRGARP